MSLFRSRVLYKAAIEGKFPGITCKWVSVNQMACGDWSLRISFEGSAEMLIAHSLMTPEMIAAILPCGHKTFRRVRGAPYSTEVRRTTRGTYCVERWWIDNEHEPAATIMAKRLGIALEADGVPQATQPGLTAAYNAGVASRHDASSRTVLATCGARIGWTSEGVVIRPRWDDLRRVVAIHRRASSGDAA